MFAHLEIFITKISLFEYLLEIGQPYILIYQLFCPIAVHW
ncbi:hypothetical protein MYAER_1404 [Microcystis aeruginosa NIES-2549]|uniref:Uncharacterized protein n=1 Tax=Microcystis aeruginosa NIES-2549 TaxID=1641812 RepID=A0A0F6RKF2_MICAE|nr:hypothetical protein MYAER_1404 [Microcystis aeruginosa NIES-2549]AOC52147.1 hypothetical protein amyaer_1416 [Microcystis aeruginosa NIES-2481]